MGGAHSQAVAEAPSKEVVDVEAPSQDVVETGAPPETSPTSAASGLHESEEPRRPNRKDALARVAEDDSGTECAATRVLGRPPGRRGGRGGPRVTGGPQKARCYQTRVALQWTPVIPESCSVPAVFIAEAETPIQVQRKSGVKPKAVPLCVPLWPTYTLSVRNNPQFPGLRWLHFNKNEQWCRAIQKIHQIDFRTSDVLDETRKLIKDAIKTSRKVGGVIQDPVDDASDEESNDDEWTARAGRFKRMPLLKVRVLGHVLNVVNVCRPLALELTDATSTFIRDAVVPSIQKARSQSVTVAETEPPAPFNFSRKETLHLPGQVLWKPSTFSYELVLKGKGAKAMDTTTDLEGHLLRVPPHRTGETFQAARKRIFQLACQAWDQRDASKRPRILPESTAA